MSPNPAPRKIRDANARDLKVRSLAADIRRGILAGTWAAGAKLPGSWTAAVVDTADEAPKRNPFAALQALKTSKYNG